MTYFLKNVDSFQFFLYLYKNKNHKQNSAKTLIKGVYIHTYIVSNVFSEKYGRPKAKKKSLDTTLGSNWVNK